MYAGNHHHQRQAKEDSTKRRLCFYCTHKGCLWFVGLPWSHPHTLNLYIVTGHFSQKRVNHQTQTVNVDGYVFVSKEDYLEKKFIEYNVFSTCGIPAFKVALMKQFQEQKRDYCYDQPLRLSGGERNILNVVIVTMVQIDTKWQRCGRREYV